MISVCIPTYNGQEYIAQQLESILIQLDEKDEIVVSDDHSTDSTIEIIKTFNDNRIKIYYNDAECGVVHNVENALKKSKGDYIFLSDQDDVWAENKVNVCLDALHKSTLVISDCYITNHKLEAIHHSFYAVNKSHNNKWFALARNPYLGCCMAFKRCLLDDVMPFPKHIPMHDIWIGNVAAFFHKTSFINDKLIFYRRHGRNASTSSEPANSSIVQKIGYRLPLISNLFIMFLKKIKH